MLVYIIQCEEIKGYTGLLGVGGKVSQEGYQTLEDAQRFCASRGAVQISPYIYHKEISENKIIRYNIIDVRIRGLNRN